MIESVDLVLNEWGRGGDDSDGHLLLEKDGPRLAVVDRDVQSVGIGLELRATGISADRSPKTDLPDARAARQPPE